MKKAKTPKVNAEHTYPQYYNVDDVPVKLIEEGNNIVGVLANGKEYPVGKVMVEGYKITEPEFNRLAKDLYTK